MRLLGLMGALFCVVPFAAAQSFAAPAGVRPPHRHTGASVLPGGRVTSPAGNEYPTGFGAFGVAVSPSAKFVATANTSPGRNSLTILERRGLGWDVRQVIVPLPDGPVMEDREWRGAFMGVAFDGDRGVYVAEGASGRIGFFDPAGERRRVIDLNQGEHRNSYSADLVLDADRHILYVADRGNSRITVVDARSRQVIASVPVAKLPFALALSPDRARLYVTRGDMYEKSLYIIDVSVPATPKVHTYLPTAGLSGVIAVGDKVYVSSAANDSITVVDGKTGEIESEIPIRIPGLESLRGIMPLGLAYHEPSGWLLAAEAGINAVAVIDTRARRVLGHIPAASFPTRVAIHGDTVFVANARGHGVGPSARVPRDELGQGTLSVFPLPDASALAAQTAVVMEANGFHPRPRPERAIPPGVKRVVLIVKGNLSYDEVFGDMPHTAGSPVLARVGEHGFADGKRRRLSIKDVNVTPNHHSIARRWALSDNFYLTGDRLPLDAIRQHLERHGVSFQNFREGAGGADLPRFLLIQLPNGRLEPERPDEGYPYEESFVAGNDHALGRILEFLSGKKEWREMAVFITEADAQGVDHIDAQRAFLLAAGPWIKRGHVSHLNTGFDGLVKTIFRVLGVPPLTLHDATAADLSGIFTTDPDFTPYKLLPVDTRLFDPGSAK